MTKRLSQRSAFTAFMSIFATAFVIGIWRQRFSWQSDYLADLSKIGLLVSISTAVMSFIIWTLTHHAKETVFRGALAGALTALVIIPLPAMVWTFKTEFFSLYQFSQSGAIEAALGAIPLAIKVGLLTFIDITKASIIAVVASAVLGAVCAYFIPGRQQEQA